MTRYTLRDSQGITREVDVPADALPGEIDDFGRLGYDTAEIPSTMWIAVHALDHATGDETRHKVAIDPDEPACASEAPHDWQSPFALVGGIKENPGVFGHDGGVRIREVCVLCGCERVIDTWAQDPTDGQEGLRSIEYREGRFTADEIAEGLS